MDCSPPGSSVHGILQARILEWVAIPFSRGLLHPGIEPESPVLQADSWPSEPPGKPSYYHFQNEELKQRWVTHVGRGRAGIWTHSGWGQCSPSFSRPGHWSLREEKAVPRFSSQVDLLSWNTAQGLGIRTESCFSFLQAWWRSGHCPQDEWSFLSKSWVFRWERLGSLKSGWEEV